MQQNNIAYYVYGYNVASNGQTAWQHLIRLQTEVVDRAATMVFVDLAVNHNTNDFDQATCEAYIRKLRVALPNATILMVIHGSWANGSATTPLKTDVIAWVLDIATHYELDVINIAATMEALIAAETNTIDDWYTSPDFTHPDSTGNAFITEQMLPRLTANYIGGGATSWTGNIADYTRLYTDTALYEATPQERTGLDNDGETGTWSTVNTSSRRSSTAASTIEWTATCSSFGLDATYGSGVIEWQIDGGAWTSFDLSSVFYNIMFVGSFANGSHTVTLRVVSGTVTIARFLAI